MPVGLETKSKRMPILGNTSSRNGCVLDSPCAECAQRQEILEKKTSDKTSERGWLDNKMSRNSGVRVAYERAPGGSSRHDRDPSNLETTLALHAERRFGLGRKAAVANRFLTPPAQPVLVSVERGQGALALPRAKLRFRARRLRHGLLLHRIHPPPIYRLVRHPIQLGILIGIWAAPVMTVGHCVFATAMSFYVFIGLLFEERDLVRQFGQRYLAYRQSVPKVIPPSGHLPRPSNKATPHGTRSDRHRENARRSEPVEGSATRVTLPRCAHLNRTPLRKHVASWSRRCVK